MRSEIEDSIDSLKILAREIERTEAVWLEDKKRHQRIALAVMVELDAMVKCVHGDADLDGHGDWYDKVTHSFPQDHDCSSCRLAVLQHALRNIGDDAGLIDGWVVEADEDKMQEQMMYPEDFGKPI